MCIMFKCWSGMVTHTSNSSTALAEAGGSIVLASMSSILLNIYYFTAWKETVIFI